MRMRCLEAVASTGPCPLAACLLDWVCVCVCVWVCLFIYLDRTALHYSQPLHIFMSMASMWKGFNITGRGRGQRAAGRGRAASCQVELMRLSPLKSKQQHGYFCLCVRYLQDISQFQLGHSHLVCLICMSKHRLHSCLANVAAKCANFSLYYTENIHIICIYIFILYISRLSVVFHFREGRGQTLCIILINLRI